MLDIAQVLLWSAAYVCIILAMLGKKEMPLAIPVIVAVSNLSWELAAVIVSGMWAHWLWLGLDVVILTACLWRTPKWRSRAMALGAAAVLVACYQWLFTVENGMLYSSFVIDLFMAVCFLVFRKKLSTKLALPIAVLKLLGDICAGIYYGMDDMLIAVIAVAVLLCNVMDLFICVERRNHNGTTV